MAARGEILTLKRRLGFGAGGALERFVVVQANVLNDVLDTTIVVPLDAAHSYYRDYAGAVLVPAAQAGTPRDQVAVLTAVGSVDMSRFEDGAVGRLGGAVLQEIDRLLAVILELS